ncbi:MAG: DHHW family protein [Faecalibacterium sp.]
MDKHARPSRLHELGRYPVLMAFSLFFVGLFALDMLTPDRAYSELENTTLTQRPSLSGFSASGLNSYFTNYTKYVKDQVFGRDSWIALQSAAETMLLQKTENGGILLGKDHMMFARDYSLISSETRTLPKNTAAVSALAQRWPGRVSVMLVPAASTVYPENIPAGAPLLDENAYLDELFSTFSASGAQVLDVRQTLADHKEEYLYYRTDHHWTTLGAYYAYEQLCSTLGLDLFDRNAHTANTQENFYGTHYSKSRDVNAQPDTLTWYELDNTMTIYTVTGPGDPEQGQATGLYDTTKLEVYDKYAMFLHGNNGLSRIQGSGEGRILVIKDSYANCFVPYLTASYEQIDVVDFRNYNYGLDKLIAQNDYDQILVLYSFDSFKSDPYLYRAGVAG